MKNVNCGYSKHKFKPTGRTYTDSDFGQKGNTVYTEFECSICGISTTWEVRN